jgi:hypothetical protein
VTASGQQLGLLDADLKLARDSFQRFGWVPLSLPVSAGRSRRSSYSECRGRRRPSPARPQFPASVYVRVVTAVRPTGGAQVIMIISGDFLQLGPMCGRWPGPGRGALEVGPGPAARASRASGCQYTLNGLQDFESESTLAAASE